MSFCVDRTQTAERRLKRARKLAALPSKSFATSTVGVIAFYEMQHVFSQHRPVTVGLYLFAAGKQFEQIRAGLHNEYNPAGSW